jgi:hypothetical protein
MAWTIDRSRQIKRKKNLPDGNMMARNAKFDDYVSRKYNELLITQQKDVVEFQRQIDAIRSEQKEIATSKSRGIIRRKKLNDIILTDLNKKIEDIKIGVKLEDFKRKVLPYMEAHERELQVNAVEKLRESNQATSLLPKDDVKSEKQATSGVMKDFIHDIENIPLEVKPMPNEICDECDDVMVLESRSSTLICPCCGNWKHYLDATSSHMAYGEEVEFTAFAYLRMNHYNERLTYSQAKESTRISDEDIQKIMERIIEHRISDVEKITMEVTYNIMKELKMRHIYKQNAQLWCRITSKPPKRMSPEQEEQLRSMFRAVNRLWPKYKPEERKNFLSYNYLLFKFCQLLGMDEFCGLYKLLKGERKLGRQDEIFKQICEDPELQWEFIPSQYNDQ